MSDAEDLFEFQCRAAGLPEPEREYRFDPERRFRADFAFPAARLLVEIEGLGIGGMGRHQYPGGFKRDLEKYNLATMNGWRVLRFIPEWVESGEALGIVEKCYGVTDK